MKRYDEEVANRVFDAHCHEEWMQEKYVPTRIQQRLRERYEEIHSLHRRLSEFIATGQILIGTVRQKANTTVCRRWEENRESGGDRKYRHRRIKFHV